MYGVVDRVEMNMPYDVALNILPTTLLAELMCQLVCRQSEGSFYGHVNFASILETWQHDYNVIHFPLVCAWLGVDSLIIV